ncbi:hypothetical protein [Microbacterium testaceum]|uniref:hypothetical protein n=1 Tax=Microbacterium testaceum TaxID=2033 RepID=UPI002434B26E|nr:hypothetical protein [Microbacterium testaceum]
MTLPSGIRLVWREVPAGSARRDVSRALLAELLPGARFRSRCPACGGDHGRIRVEGADAAVSVSYVEGWAVAVAARGYERVGLDAVPADAGGLERVLPAEAYLWPTGVAERITRASPAGGPDRAQARAWARVEAVLKADGRGIVVDPQQVEVALDGTTWLARVRPVPRGQAWSRSDDELVAGARGWRGWDLDGPDGVVLAVATPAPAETVAADA